MKPGSLPLAGKERQTGVLFGVDWLAFTVKMLAAEQVKQWLRKCLGEDWRAWEVISHRDRRARWKGPFGTLLEVDWVERWVHVEIKGQGCRALGTEKVMLLCESSIQQFGEAFRVTRADLAWDDFDKRCRPSDLRERFWDREAGAKRPEVVTKAKRGHFRQDDGPEGGESYTIGERSSNRMLRVYDKAAESGGKVDAVRWELQCREEVAQCVIEAMLRANYGTAALGYLVGFVDFREVGASRKLKDRRRCAWFEAIVGGARRAPLRPTERVDLEDWVRTFMRQQSSGFRMLVHVCGGDLLAAANALSAANPKDNPRHRGWHERLKREGLASVAHLVRPGTEAAGP